MGARSIGIKGESCVQNQAKIKVSYVQEGPTPPADSGVCTLLYLQACGLWGCLIIK